MIYQDVFCLNILIETTINIIDYFLALGAGGVSDVKLQQSVLTLRNRAIHRCDLSNVCNVLEINIELLLFRDDNEKCRVEHYPKYPSVECDENIS